VPFEALVRAMPPPPVPADDPEAGLPTSMQLVKVMLPVPPVIATAPPEVAAVFSEKVLGCTIRIPLGTATAPPLVEPLLPDTVLLRMLRNVPLLLKMAAPSVPLLVVKLALLMSAHAEVPVM